MMKSATVLPVNEYSDGIAKHLSDDNFDKLECVMEWIKKPKGDYLFWEGDQETELYFVRSGKVKLTKETDDGKALILSIVGSGELVGEYGATIHNISAEITEDAELGVVSLSDLQSIMRENGSFSLEFINWMSVNIQRNQSKMRDMLLYGKAGALASTLIRLSNSHGVELNDGRIFLDVKLTNSDVGRLIGMARENVSRLFGQWKEEGTISIDGDYRIIIENMSNLRKICNCPMYALCPKEICRI